MCNRFSAWSVALAIIPAIAWAADPYIPRAQLTGSGARYGRTVSVSADGTRAIVAPSARILIRAGETWSQESADLRTNPVIGAAISGAGDLAVLVYEGGVDFFRRTGTSWAVQQSLGFGAFFSTAAHVAISGDGSTVAVSALAANSATIVSRFRFDSGSWIQEPLTAPAGQVFLATDIPASLAVDGSGALIAVACAGGVAFYEPGATSFLAVPSPASIALSGDANTLLLGDLTYSVGAAFLQGQVNVYTRSAGSFQFVQSLYSPDPYALGNFGWSNSLTPNGNTAVVGQAPFLNAGADAPFRAYVFQRANGSYQYLQTLSGNSVQQNQFGSTTAISADASTILVGAPNEPANGRAYVFRPPPVQYPLTTFVSGPGSVTPAGTTYYDAGTVVTATATANAGSGFVRWTGDSTSTLASIPVTMNGPRSLTALFGAPTPAFVTPVGTPTRSLVSNGPQQLWQVTFTYRNTGGTAATGVYVNPVTETPGAFVNVWLQALAAIPPGASATGFIQLFVPQGMRLVRLRLTLSWDSAAPRQIVVTVPL